MPCVRTFVKRSKNETKVILTFSICCTIIMTQRVLFLVYCLYKRSDFFLKVQRNILMRFIILIMIEMVRHLLFFALKYHFVPWQGVNARKKVQFMRFLSHCVLTCAILELLMGY